MICISIYQESRRLALVDMLNASRQCELLEVRLDRFGKAPEVGEMLAAKPRPIIFSCRRPQDGGDWDGTEDERLAILRQCVVARADHIEIEHDVADQVRRFGPTKRVLSYTNLQGTPVDIADIYAQMQKKDPDVIKLVTRVRTPEEAWPLVQILAKPALPTVVVGLGPSGVMLTLLARKIGAPWTYAALERGMEAYPGQVTVEALNTVYRYPDIGRSTRFAGVIGSGRREYISLALLNAAFAHLELPTRCLPLEVGNLRLFRKVVEAVKLHAIVVDQEHRESIRELAARLQGAAERSRCIDLLGQQGDEWTGFLLLARAVVSAVEGVLRHKYKEPTPLQGRVFLIAGITPLSREVAHRLARNGARLVVTDRDRTKAHVLAQVLECRAVQFEALYSTLHDVLIFGGETGSGREQPLHPGYLKPNMAVMDLSAPLYSSPLLREAEQRGCLVVHPFQVLLEQVAQQARVITGKDVPPEVLRQTLEQVWIEEE
jgi:3-dehydroquinate dehydratase/shikimate dehydrogenase